MRSIMASVMQGADMVDRTAHLSWSTLVIVLTSLYDTWTDNANVSMLGPSAVLLYPASR